MLVLKLSCNSVMHLKRLDLLKCQYNYSSIVMCNKALTKYASIKRNYNAQFYLYFASLATSPTASYPSSNISTNRLHSKLLSARNYSSIKDDVQKTKPHSFDKLKKQIQNVSPFLKRVGIVSLSVGLLTPLFATLGATQIWYHYLPKTKQGQYFKYGLSIVIGGGGATFIYNYFLPFLLNHAEIILPFALSNALISSLWYTLAEVSLGYEYFAKPLESSEISIFAQSANHFEQVKNMLSSSRQPVIGAGVGILTACTSPIIWPLSFQLCFLHDPILSGFLRLNDVSWLIDLYSWILIPIAIPLGFLSGITLQVALRPILYPSISSPSLTNNTSNSNDGNNSHDSKSKHNWSNMQVPFLFGLLTLSLVYFTICRSTSETYCYESRIDTKSGDIYSFNIITGDVVFDFGEKAQISQMKRNFISTLQLMRTFVPNFIFISNKKGSKHTTTAMESYKRGRYLNLLATIPQNQSQSQSSLPSDSNNNNMEKKIIHPLADINYCTDRQTMVNLTDTILHYIYLRRQHMLISQANNVNVDGFELKRLESNISRVLDEFALTYEVIEVMKFNQTKQRNARESNPSVVDFMETLLECIDGSICIEATMKSSPTITSESKPLQCYYSSIKNMTANLANSVSKSSTAPKSSQQSYLSYIVSPFMKSRPKTIEEWLKNYEQRYVSYTNNAESIKKYIMFSKLLYAVSLLSENFDFYEYELKAKVYDVKV